MTPVQADQYLQHHREMADHCLHDVTELQDGIHELPPSDVVALAQAHAMMALVVLVEHLVVELRGLREVGQLHCDDVPGVDDDAVHFVQPTPAPPQPNRAERRRAARQSSTVQPITMTLPDVLAALPGMSERTLFRVLREGTLPSFKIGRARVVMRADLERWLEEQKGVRDDAPAEETPGASQFAD